MKDKEKYIDNSWKAKMVEKGLYKDSEITSEEKQIEEMKDVVHNLWDKLNQDAITTNDIVNALYEQGYRKLPKDSVVLSKEEYIKWLNDKDKDIKEYREIERKETAYNILDMVDYESNGQTEQITNLIRKRFSDNGVKHTIKQGNGREDFGMDRHLLPLL